MTKDSATNEAGNMGGGQPRVLYLARRWFVAARDRLEEITRIHGMTPGDYTLLSFINHLAPCSAAELARAMHITPQAATQQVAQLENKALISRYENAANRRIALIELTAHGRTCLRDIDRRADRLEAELTAGLTDDELRTIHAFLSRRPDTRGNDKNIGEEAGI